ncbi:alpha/beta hydrolase [Pseudomonas sp. CrR25]|nr:alpha/beta hydrolase [Pseudomonas sp. CrR25]
MSAPVVLIHGLIGSLQLPELTRLLAPFEVLAPDLLGYGALRDAPVGAVNIPAQVEHLRSTLQRHYGTEPVHLLGHSVGGVVAALFAHRYGERVRSLISLEGNFTLKDAFWSASVARLSLEQVEVMLEGFRRDPAAWLAGAGVAVDAEAVRIATCWLAQQPASTVRAMAQSVVTQTGPVEYLEQMREVFARHPVHLIAGERSRGGWDVPQWACQAAASQALIPAAGHLMMLEQPAALTGELQRVLQLA